MNNNEQSTFWQKAADALAKYAGSGGFVIGFGLILISWIFLNEYYWYVYLPEEPFDPKPFILLNLVLYCLAAIQVPIILITQKRQAQRNRQIAEYDYAANGKA